MSKKTLDQMVAIINRAKSVGQGSFNGSAGQVRAFVAMANRVGLGVVSLNECEDIEGLFCVQVAT